MKHQDKNTESSILQSTAHAFFNALCAKVGETPTREGLLNTSNRISTSYADILSGYQKTPKEVLGNVFEDGVCDEMIVLKKLPFYSMCEHHLLPFFGHISLGYIPDSRLVGISGLARLVEVFTKRLQIQETLTSQIADSICDELKPQGVMVVCEARHLCLEMRGQGTQSSIITSALRGNFKRDSKTRSEFMRLITD